MITPVGEPRLNVIERKEIRKKLNNILDSIFRLLPIL